LPCGFAFLSAIVTQRNMGKFTRTRLNPSFRSPAAVSYGWGFVYACLIHSPFSPLNEARYDANLSGSPCSAFDRGRKKFLDSHICKRFVYSLMFTGFLYNLRISFLRSVDSSSNDRGFGGREPFLVFFHVSKAAFCAAISLSRFFF